MLSEPGTLSTSILDGLRRQDPEAWKRFVFLFAPLIYRWCRRRGLQPRDAEDIGQEVFQAVYGKISSFKRDRPCDSFTAWLRRITENKIRDHWKKRRTKDHGIGGDIIDDIPDDAQDPDDETGLLPSDKRALVERALAIVAAEFEPKSVEAFKRLVLEGQEPKAVADQLDMSINAVYLVKSRILQRLREELDGLFEPE